MLAWTANNGKIRSNFVKCPFLGAPVLGEYRYGPERWPVCLDRSGVHVPARLARCSRSPVRVRHRGAAALPCRAPRLCGLPRAVLCIFAAFHGRCFASLPRVQVHVPLYVADVVWSDFLYTHGVRFATVPGRPFQHFSHYSDQHLHDQRPSGWTRGTERLVLSDAFLRFADIIGPGARGDLDARGGNDRTQHAEADYRIGPRAHAGITPTGMFTNEARTKYGTTREARRVMQLAARRTGRTTKSTPHSLLGQDIFFSGTLREANSSANKKCKIAWHS